MISEKATIAKNAGILVIADVLNRFLGAVLTIIIARKLGAADLGLLAFALAFANPFGFLAGFGFKDLISRDVAKEPTDTDRYLGSAFVIKLAFAAIVLFIVVMIVRTMHYSETKILVIYIAAFVMLTDSFIEFLSAFFRAHQRVVYEAIVTIILNFLTASTGLAILFFGYGLVPLMTVRFLVHLLCFAFGCVLVVKKLSKPSFDIELGFCRQLIKSALPFAVLGIVVGMNAQLGTILLSLIKGDLATGWYSAAQRLTGVFGFIPMAFGGAVLPAMSRFSQKSMREDLVQAYEGTMKYLLIIVLPLATGISILADDLILMIYGVEFIQSVIVLRILIWFLVFSFLNRACMIAFASTNRENRFMKLQILGTTVNLGLSIALIPPLGHIGVSVAVVVSQMSIFVFSVHGLSEDFRRARRRDIYVKPVLAVLLMAAFLFLFRQKNLVLLVPTSALLYGLSLFLLRTFSHNELSVLREVFRQRAARVEFK